VIRDYDTGRITIHEAATGLLRLIERDNVKAVLENPDPEVETCVREFVKDFGPWMRSTGPLPSNEQVVIAREWFEHVDRAGGPESR
jgi:hypothetical protein